MITLLVLMVFYTDGTFKAALLQVPSGQCETMGKDVQFRCVETVARARS